MCQSGETGDQVSKTASAACPRIPRWPRAWRRALLATMLACGVLLLASPPGSAHDWTYRIRPGDTLWHVSGKYLRNDVAWQRLQAHNRIADPDRLRPGTVLRLPVAWLRVQPAKATVVGVHGEAFVDGANGQPARVVEGMRLGIGTTLRTSADASLSLQFADGSRLLLHANSELTLDKLSAYGATGMTDRKYKSTVNNPIVKSPLIDSTKENIKSVGA